MTAPKYLPPDYRREELVGSQDCIDRAQRALEIAEMNLDKFAGMKFDEATTIAHADARARIGQGWAALALAMRTGR